MESQFPQTSFDVPFASTNSIGRGETKRVGDEEDEEETTEEASETEFTYDEVECDGVVRTVERLDG